MNKQLKKDSVVSSEVRSVEQNTKDVLPKELIQVLDKEAKLVSVERKGRRKKIVDWIEVLEHCCEITWFTKDYITKHVQEKYNKNKLRYSEFYRVIDMWNRKENLHVTKKEVPSGKYKNCYYKVEMI